MDPSPNQLPTKYYVDFENVHGAGLKGIDALGERDEVFVFYSQAAETFHIEQAIDIMKSKARIEFVEIDGGTRNSLDFQLVAALFGTMTEGYEYAIVSGDGGFDAAIKMGQRLELPSVRRITDLTGSTESPQPKSTRQRRTRQSRQKDKKEQSDQAEQAESTGRADQPERETPATSATQTEKTKQAEQETAPNRQKLPKAKEPHQLPAPDKAGAPSSDADADADAESPRREKPTEQEGAEEKESNSASGRSGRYSKRKEVKALLADNGVTLNQQQLSSVMKALNGVKNKQGFYRSIIQAEKQERGLELYRQVRDHYEAMVEILRS